jgi:hypothetical protein
MIVLTGDVQWCLGRLLQGAHHNITITTMTDGNVKYSQKNSSCSHRFPDRGALLPHPYDPCYKQYAAHDHFPNSNDKIWTQISPSCSLSSGSQKNKHLVLSTTHYLLHSKPPNQPRFVIHCMLDSDGAHLAPNGSTFRSSTSVPWL